MHKEKRKEKKKSESVGSHFSGCDSNKIKMVERMSRRQKEKMENECESGCNGSW